MNVWGCDIRPVTALTVAGWGILERDSVKLLAGHGAAFRHATLDRNTRRREGLKGPGAAATMINPEGAVMGGSCDYPFVKVLDPRLMVTG